VLQEKVWALLQGCAFREAYARKWRILTSYGSIGCWHVEAGKSR